MNMLGKYFVAWLPGIVIAILNGVLREGVYGQYVGLLTAHQLSALSFVVLFGLYVWGALRCLKISSGREALRIGIFWLALSVGFEFLFGHFVMGHPWAVLLHDYNLMEGRLWVLVLAWICTAPYILFRWNDSTRASTDGPTTGGV
jgi:hypothetical protein